MKRLLILTCLAGVAGWLVAGCGKKPAAPPATKPGKTNHVARITAPKPQPTKPAKPARPSREVLPGTIDYLDLKNGFRDVTFGEWETNITNLVVKTRDDARQLKTCVRSGDVLSLHGVPVESIEYNFLKGQLYAVEITWNITRPDSALSQPPTTSLSVYCAREYGAPRTRRVRKDGGEFVWRGHKAELMLAESLMPGVSDLVKGGWALPPTTTGRIVIRNLRLSRIAEAGLDTQMTQQTDGL